jgi:hypothetical protein
MKMLIKNPGPYNHDPSSELLNRKRISSMLPFSKDTTGLTHDVTLQASGRN